MIKWETFLDHSYFDMHAVRPMGDKDFKSSLLFHVVQKEEAVRLRDLLNQYEDKSDAK